MRREDFTIDADDDRPTLTITFTGTPQTLRERLDDDGRTRGVSDLDVAYRRTPTDEADGVLGITDRMTGAFVFEATADADAIRRVVDSATATGDDDPQYTLRIDPGDGDPLVGEQTTLLVYDPDGSLDRPASLIPGSVEL